MEHRNERYNFPENIERITAGQGAESLIIYGKSKTILLDTGMPYCYKRLIDNIWNSLKTRGREKIDYILLSHSHYDHTGAVPYLINAWPEVQIVAAAKCKKVFESETARSVMKRLGESARDSYGNEEEKKEEILVSPLRVDIVLGDGDKFVTDLDSGEYFAVLETKGHTDCSLTFVFEPQSIMFASESTGVMSSPVRIETAILKSYKETIEAALKCKEYGAKKIVSPHYGMVADSVANTYFDLYIKMAEQERDLVLRLYEENKTFEKTLEAYTDYYWGDGRAQTQPKAAFLENATPIVKTIIREFTE